MASRQIINSIILMILFVGSMSNIAFAQPTNHTLEKTKRIIPPLSDTVLSDLFANMILVKGGEFNFGTNDAEASLIEKPSYKASLDDFYIGKYEVTQHIFESVMGWNNSYHNCENCPVNNISFHNVTLFIKRLNDLTGKVFRLPTEAEWEFAAKGGVKTKKYKFSGSDNISDIAWYNENANRKSHPVGLKLANELGIHDMTGNLWEFCQDNLLSKRYKPLSFHNPIETSKTSSKVNLKVTRGGGYEYSAQESLIYRRDGVSENLRMPDIGFRLAMSRK